MLDIHGVLDRLAGDRPVFHSESDFQHALAWRIHQENPTARIRLETRPQRGIRLDLLVDLSGERTAIELKYFIRRFTAIVHDELYDLPNQGAHDISRYDFVKDIVRVETCIRSGFANHGWALALSNDPGYWGAGRKPDPIDNAFRLHDGRTLNGVLTWGPGAGAGTMRSREEGLSLSGSYACAWRHYSEIEGETKRTAFRYLAVKVG
jgi:hypothetical protein